MGSNPLRRRIFFYFHAVTFMYNNSSPKRELEKQKGSKSSQNCQRIVLKNCWHGGVGCQKSGKIANIIYGWFLIQFLFIRNNELTLLLPLEQLWMKCIHIIVLSLKIFNQNYFQPILQVSSDILSRNCNGYLLKELVLLEFSVHLRWDSFGKLINYPIFYLIIYHILRTSEWMITLFRKN